MTQTYSSSCPAGSLGDESPPLGTTSDNVLCVFPVQSHLLEIFIHSVMSCPLWSAQRQCIEIYASFVTFIEAERGSSAPCQHITQPNSWPYMASLTWSSTKQLARPTPRLRPIGDLWRRAISRGRNGATTLRRRNHDDDDDDDDDLSLLSNPAAAAAAGSRSTAGRPAGREWSAASWVGRCR